MKRALEILILAAMLGSACDADESDTSVETDTPVETDREHQPEVTAQERPCEFDPNAIVPTPSPPRGVRDPTWRVDEDQEAAGLRALAPVTSAELAAARSFSTPR